MAALLFAPAVLLIIGLAYAISPTKAGLFFSRISGRHSKQAATGRLWGILFVIISLIFAGMMIASLHGPNDFAAMREAQIYLHDEYGSSFRWKLSCKSSPDGQNAVDIRYTHSDNHGMLHGIWTGSNYQFTETRDQ